MTARSAQAIRPVDLGPGTLTFFRLEELSESIREREEYRRSGVTGITLTRDEHVTVVLAALRAGAVMREHRAPSAATVVVLSGRLDFVAGAGEPGGKPGAGERSGKPGSGEHRTELGPGALAAFAADVPHALEARTDAVYLVVIGGRQRPDNA
jgi:quercetin dioxygenase-like cupin family protein